MSRNKVEGSLRSDTGTKSSYRGGSRYIESRLFTASYNGPMATTTFWDDGKVAFEVREEGGRTAFDLTVYLDPDGIKVYVDSGAELVVKAART